MAGMFYSLKETAAKLGKSEDEVKQLAKDGRLREFRDGSNLLFKIDEVNALLAEGPEAEPEADLNLDFEPEEAAPAEPELEAAEPDLDFELPEPDESTEPAAAAPAEPELEAAEPDLDFELPEPDESAEPAAPTPAEPELDFELTESDEVAEPAEPVKRDEVAEPVEEDVPLELDEAEAPDLPAQADATAALDLAPDTDEEGTAEFMADDLLRSEEAPGESVMELGDDEDISLAPETGLMGGSDITDMDTALTGEGVNVLGDSDAEDYGVTDDSLAETVGPAGTSTEASLEEIEEDVNLDSFGSGSGLLDLSLQADDTSLGGILDDIYTRDGGEEEPGGASGSAEDLTAEVEHVGPEDDLAVPEPVVAAPVAVGAAYVEAPPDTQSNMLGFLLFIPLLALLYTTVVVWAGQKHVMPSVLEGIQGLILPIIAVASLVTVGVFGLSFVLGGDKAPKAAKTKTKKAKKEKAPKEKKAKAKKEKAPKAEKPKKEKKPLFGKKKAK